MLNRKKFVKFSTAVILAVALLAGCGNVPQAESSSLPESSISSQESSSESASSQPVSETPPEQEDKGAKALSEMRLLSGRVSEYRDSLQKIAKPLDENGKKIEAELEQARTYLENAGQSDYKGAETALQAVSEHLAAAEEAQALISEAKADALAQADEILEKLKDLQKQSADLLETAEEKKASLTMLKELIDKEAGRADEAKAQMEQAAKTEEAFSEESAQITEEREQILTAKKAEQEAAQKAAEEAARASSTPAPEPASSAPEKAETKQDSENHSSKIVVKKAETNTDSNQESGYTRKTKAEDGVLQELNAYRKSIGIGEVTRDSGLDDCSAIRVVEMLDNDIFSHTRPDGTSWETVLSENGIKPMAWGEIQYRRWGDLAVGTNSEMTNQCFDGWKTSKGHDAIMRSATYTKVGIAIYASGDEEWIANVIFIQ